MEPEKSSAELKSDVLMWGWCFVVQTGIMLYEAATHNDLWLGVSLAILYFVLKLLIRDWDHYDAARAKELQP